MLFTNILFVFKENVLFYEKKSLVFTPPRSLSPDSAVFGQM